MKLRFRHTFAQAADFVEPDFVEFPSKRLSRACFRRTPRHQSFLNPETELNIANLI